MRAKFPAANLHLNQRRLRSAMTATAAMEMASDGELADAEISGRNGELARELVRVSRALAEN
jgi:hypothetical protein